MILRFITERRMGGSIYSKKNNKTRDLMCEQVFSASFWQGVLSLSL